MNILFVDDQPEFKVTPYISYLKSKNLSFDYTIMQSRNSALRYVHKNSNQFDLAVIDLGLPIFDFEKRNYGKFDGFIVMDAILTNNIQIPIIINSTTVMPNEEAYLKPFRDDGATITHVTQLDVKWLYEYIVQLQNT